MSFNALAAVGRSLSCLCDGMEEACQCPPEERALRAYAWTHMPPMSPGEREECLSWIGSIEGWRRDDYENEPDSSLARGVLNSMLDYCRDKGLI